MSKLAIPKFKPRQQYVNKKLLGQELKQQIFKIRSTMKGSQTREALAQLAGLVSPKKGIDVSDLPIYSPNGRSRKPRKSACIAAAISYLVQQYWSYCNTGKPSLQTIKHRLDKLAGVDLAKCKIVGDEGKGFELES